MGIKVLTEPESILEAVQGTIKGGHASIAVAFWGTGAPESLGLTKVGPEGIRIVCNLSSGGCNPEVIRDLLKRGFNIRAHQDLHAKVYIGESSAVVGSANASSGGLGLAEDGAGWKEACVSVDTKPQIDELQVWFEALWEDASDLLSPQVARLLLENARLFPPEMRVDPEEVLSALRKDKESLRNKSVFVSIDWEPYDQRVSRKIKELGKEIGGSIDAWQEWDDMPGSAYIISFYSKGPEGRVKFDGVFRTPPEPKKELDAETGAIFVPRARLILETFRVGNAGDWLDAVRRWREDALQDKVALKQGGQRMHIVEFFEEYCQDR